MAVFVTAFTVAILRNPPKKTIIQEAGELSRNIVDEFNKGYKADSTKKDSIQ